MAVNAGRTSHGSITFTDKGARGAPRTFRVLGSPRKEAGRGGDYGKAGLAAGVYGAVKGDR